MQLKVTTGGSKKDYDRGSNAGDCEKGEKWRHNRKTKGALLSGPSSIAKGPDKRTTPGENSRKTVW